MTEQVRASRGLVIGRPGPDEHAPYYDGYISKLPGNDILAILDQQRREMLLLLSSRSEADGDLRYAPGKWSVREVIGHICDSERVFAYRALSIARGDPTPLPGFDENSWSDHAPWATRHM